MKILSGLIFLAIVAFLGWPYYHLYQLNSAVADNNPAAFDKLIDIDAVRKVHKDNMEWKINNTGGMQGNVIADTIREGAKVLGNTAADTIDTDWMLARLHKTPGSLWEQLSFAFFESPTRFMVRLGKLGQEPIYVQMTMQDWYWRVTGIYE